MARFDFIDLGRCLSDVISKLRELANGGDAAALAEIKQLDGWIKTKDLRNLQQFENTLIDLAREKFGMLLPHEAVDMDRLRDDRHLCAHPAFVSDDGLFSPTPELVRAHIAHAILHLLSRPPVQGKQLIERYDRDLLGGSIPKSAEDIELVLRENYLGNAKLGSVVSLAKALAKALVGSEAATYKGKENQIAISLAAIGRLAPGLFEEHIPPVIERLGRDLNDDKVLNVCRYVEAEPRIWEWLGQAGQTRVLAKIEHSPLKEVIPAFKARHVPVVGEVLLNKVKTEEIKAQESVLSKVPCRSFVSAALDLYGSSGSFVTAEKRGIEVLLPHAKYFVVNDVERLNAVIRGSKYDQILNASQTATILTQVFDQARQLLPAASSHWSEIAKYIVEKNAASDYDYPKFLSELKKASVPIPELPASDDAETDLLY